METKINHFKKIPKQIKTKFDNLYSPYRKGETQYGILSTKKKIKKEIASMSKENSKEFRDALNKYSFDLEVFIPRTMSINKNEYKNKNFLLNSLVSFEHKSQERKKLALSLRKENNMFSTEYNIIKNQNEEHQKKYLNDLEKFYHNIGYNINSIEYNNTDNIFNPSSVLDHDFGVSIQDDAYKYSNLGLQNDYDKDKILLKKWMKSIEETKENRNRSRKVEDGEMSFRKGSENEEIKEKEKEKEIKSIEHHKEIEKIKNDLVEENRIRNMTRKEYFQFNRKIKKEIQITKRLLEDFNKNKNNNINNKTSYFSPNKINLKMTFNMDKNNITGKSYKIVHPSRNKNYKEKIVFPIYKNKETIKKSETKESPVSITENNIFLSSDKNSPKNNKKDPLPKISIILDDEKEHKNNTLNEVDKNQIKSETLSIKKQRIKDLDHLYNLVYNNKLNFFERYPSKSVEAYFKKYTNKRIPVVNFKKGSNIHGLLEDIQQIVRKKDFYKIAESSNDVKRELRNKQGLSSYSKNMTGYKKFDVDKIQEMDNKIPELHYYLAENLLINKTKKNKRKYI